MAKPNYTLLIVQLKSVSISLLDKGNNRGRFQANVSFLGVA